MNKLLPSFLFLIIACNSGYDKSKPRKNVPVPWQYLTLQLNDTVIQVIRPLDTLEIETFKEGMQKYFIEKAQKDSLFSWSNSLIEFEGQPKWFCTDYVSKLKVRITYNSQLSKEASFSSLCNWQELDSNTIKIDQMLKQILKIE